MPPLPFLLFILTSFTFLPCSDATLFNPQLAAHSSIPNELGEYGSACFDNVYFEEQLIFASIGCAEVAKAMVFNMSQSGQIEAFGIYDIGIYSEFFFPLDNQALFSVYNDAGHTPNTTVVLVDIVKNETITKVMVNTTMRFVRIRPRNSVYAMYATTKDNTTIQLFPWSETEFVDLNPVVVTLPEYEYIFVGMHIYTITNNVLCAFRLSKNADPVTCVNLVEFANVCNVFSCNVQFKFEFSPSGERLFLWPSYTWLGEHFLLALDINDDEINFFTVLASDSFGYYTFSFHGDFMLQNEKYLVDISTGQRNLLYNFGNFYSHYDTRYGITPDDKFAIYANYMKEDSTFQFFAYDVSPSLSPSIFHFPLDFEPYIDLEVSDNKLLIDESLGLAFFPSVNPPYVYAVNLDSLQNSTSFPVANNEEYSIKQGILFKEPSCKWFSKISQEYMPEYDGRYFTLSFFQFDPRSSSFYKTITFVPNPYVPVAHKIWVASNGDLFMAVLWSVFDEENVPHGYASAQLSVYEVYHETTFPDYTVYPRATIELGECVAPFISNYIEKTANLYYAVWSDDALTEELLPYEGGVNFSIVVGSASDSYSLNWLDFSYSSATETLTVRQNVTVSSDCMVIQSMRVNVDTWVLCVDTSTQYQVRQYIGDIAHPKRQFLTHTLYDAKFDLIFNWWVSADGNRFSIANASGIFMFDTYTLRCTYVIESGFSYETVGIYHSNLPQTTYILVLEDDLYFDCSPGTRPNPSSYCSKCPPGTYGYGCMPCPPGFVCDEYGLDTPTHLCPAGYYCEAGTSTDKYGLENSPKPCLAGSYCADGMTTSVVGTDRSSPKACMARFYCPPASKLPTAEVCPDRTYSEYGAKTLHDCLCEDGYFGDYGVCMQCPPQCTCTGNVISGCWVSAPFDETTVPLLCPVNSVMGTTACNPNKTAWHGDIAFPCAPGYTDRQCSKCMRGYFSAGRACKLCTHNSLLPFVYLIGVILLLAYAWNIQPVNSATLKIIVMHFQTLLIFVLGGMEWDNLTSKFVHSSSSYFNFSISAIECLFPGWTLMHSLVVTVTLPAFVGLCVLASGVLVWSVKRVKDCISSCKTEDKPQIDLARVRLQMAKTMVTLMDLLYFSVALMAFQMLGCVSSNEGYYLTSYPWLRCATKSWHPYVGVAVVALVLEVILPPIVLMVALRMNQNLLLRKKTKTILGSFYLVYSQENYLWEGLVIIKRLGIAFMSTIIPYGNIVLYVALFITFHFYGIVLLRRMPYVRRKDNIMAIASQAILLTTLYCGFFVNFAVPTEQRLELSYFAGIVNLAFMVCGAMYILFEKVPLAFGQVLNLLKYRSLPTTTEEEISDDKIPLLDLNDLEGVN